MITGQLVGFDRILAWLHETPDAVASGLARVVVKLGLDLQRNIRGGNLANRRLAEHSLAGSVGVKASLHRTRGAFGHSGAEKTRIRRASAPRTDLSEQSFLRAALEQMSPAIDDMIEATLRTAITE